MKWVASQYTAQVKCSSGDLLLHNSFMGAVANIPRHAVKEIENHLINGISEKDLNITYLKDLCDNGFFVPSNTDEVNIASRIMNKELNLDYHLIILPHEDCNFRCTYCYESFERGKMKANTVEGLKKLVKIKTSQGRHIVTSWFGGEPLLAKDVIYELSDSFIESCESQGLIYRSNITTNGYFLTSDVLSELLKRKLEHFQITLDGPEGLHNINRHLKGGQGTYKVILDNLKQMRSRCEKFMVTIRVNFNDTTLSVIDEYLSELAELFVGDDRFRLDFQAIGQWGGPNDDILEVCDSNSIWLKTLEFQEKALSYGFSDTIIKRKLNPHGSSCYAGKSSSIVVRSDGKICKCTVALDDPRNLVGKLTNDGQLNIDESLWNLWVTMNNKEDSKCGSCSFSASCESRSCPLQAIRTGTPPCPTSKTQYESLVKLAAFGKIDIPNKIEMMEKHRIKING